MLEPIERTGQPVVSIVDGLADAARSVPTRPAVDDGSLRLSRIDVYVAAMRLARELVQRVPRGKPIGVCVGNDAFFAIAVLACAAAGCPHVVLDIRYPVARNTEIIRRAGIVAIIERADQQAATSNLGSTLPHVIIESASFTRVMPAAELIAPPRPLELDEPFVLLFTSGSTGSPKGVVHSQRSILHSVYPDVEVLQIGEDDRSLSIWSPSTIAGLRALLSGFHAGTLTVLRDPRSGLPQIIETLANERITIARCVPTLMRAIARVDGAREAMRDLRVLQLGGERVYGTDLDLLRPLLPADCRISIGFGSTEAGVIAQWFVNDTVRGVVPSGYAVRGTTLEIVAPDGMPVRSGEIGELRSYGPATALGLWDGERTLADGITILADDPFSRAICTGDLFRRRADGMLEHAGRVDRMVKIRGQRVDLGDVEAAVRACHGVLDAAVVAPNVGDAARIAAFIVGERGTGRSAAALRHELRSRLPEHMVPAAFHFIDAVPQLPGFKPDIAALEHLAAVSGGRQARPAKPARLADDTIAAAVAHVWSELLGSESVANDDCWDDAGGDSLKMLQLAYGIQRLVGRPIALAAMRPNMRVRELIGRLTNQRDSTDGPRAHAKTVILLPGVLGDEPRLVAFRALLGDELRVVLPSYASWTAIVLRDTSLSDIVDDVIDQIRQNADGTPYVLVGYSFGGLIAHEVARRLRESGESVAFVGILDMSLMSIEPSTDDAAWRRERLARLVRDVRKDGIGKALGIRTGYRLARTVHRSATLRRFFARCSNRLPLPSHVAFSFDYHMTWFVRGGLAKGWKPVRHAASTTLYRVRSYAPGIARDLGWEKYVSPLDIQDVDGTHESMIVGSDGERLAHSLRLAIARHL